MGEERVAHLTGLVNQMKAQGLDTADAERLLHSYQAFLKLAQNILDDFEAESARGSENNRAAR